MNVTNGGLMDLLSKCSLVDHLDVTGKRIFKQRVETDGIHQGLVKYILWLINLKLYILGTPLGLPARKVKNEVSHAKKGNEIFNSSFPFLPFWQRIAISGCCSFKIPDMYL